MLGSYGLAILVVSLLAAAAIVGAYVLAYAAHCFLTVLEQTAAGSQEIDWPDEPFHDWIWKSIYLLWLTAFWLAPIWLTVRALELSLVAKLLLGGGLFALVFPISLLCSLSSQSWLGVVSGAVLRRLARVGLALPAFYLMTGLLLASAAAVAGFGLVGWQSFSASAAAAGPGWLGAVLDIWAWLIVLPVTALASALALLTYGRLLGRLGGRLRHVQLAGQEMDDEEDEEVDEKPAARPRLLARQTVPVPPPGEAEGEVFALVEEAPPTPILFELPRTSSIPSEPTVRSEPTQPLPLSAVFVFLGQRSTWGVLAWLTVGGSILAAIVRVEILIWPF